MDKGGLARKVSVAKVMAALLVGWIIRLLRSGRSGSLRRLTRAFIHSKFLIYNEEDPMAVSIYTTPSCSYCRVAKDWLKKEGVPFSEYDVSRDPRRADEMLKRSGQMGVPVLEVHGRIIIGFNQGEIEKALRRA
jgi:glutaredoxin-like YruB-family protein